MIGTGSGFGLLLEFLDAIFSTLGLRDLVANFVCVLHHISKRGAVLALQFVERGQAVLHLFQAAGAGIEMREAIAHGERGILARLFTKLQTLAPGQRPDANVDPFGRPIPGMGADISNRVQVPDQGDLQKAREILEELFRRAGERSRSPEELDYLNRLLRRF